MKNSGSVLSVLVMAIAPVVALAAVPARQVVETVQVNVVNLEVYVTDADGRPVRGLNRDDFTLLVDGKPVALSNFYAATPAVAEPAPGEAASALAVAPEVPPEQVLNIVIVVDNHNLTTSGRNLVLGRLEEFLDSWVRPQDKVMISTFDRTLKIRHPFAAAPRDAARTLAEMRRETSEQPFQAAEEHRLLAELEPSRANTDIGEGPAEQARRTLQSIQALAAERYMLAQTEAQALIGLSDQLAGLPGRKALVFVSDGFPRRQGEELFAAWEIAFPDIAQGGNSVCPGPCTSVFEASHFDVGSFLIQAHRHANAAGVTIYSVNALAHRGLEGTSAETAGMDILPAYWQQVTMNRGQTMFDFAAATGGRSFFNTPTLGEAFSTMAQDLESYYSLGFTPAQVGSGAYHRFEVKLARPGLKLRYREGYLDLSSDQRLDARARAALFVSGPDNALGCTVEIGEGKPGTGKTFTVPFVVRIPGRSVVLVPDGETAHGRLTFVFASEDLKGRQSELQRRTIDVPVPTRDLEVMAKQSLAFDFALNLRPGSQRIAVTVRDEVTKIDATVVMPLTLTGTGFLR